MAVQAQLYPENLGLPMCGLQDCMPYPLPASDTDISFTLHHHERQHPRFAHLQQTSQNLALDCNRGASSSSSCCRSIFSMTLSQSLDAQLELQRQEIDCILQMQNDRLRSALQEQRKQQLVIVLENMESKAMNLMRLKEEDLAQARKKRMELEVYLRKAEMESESWQRVAKENEAMVMDLSNTLEQVRQRKVLVSNNRADGAESCSGSWYEEEVKEENRKIACKRCNFRNSCIIFLPCRHLCSCRLCEASLDSCPVCNSAKETSMEVFWF
ncbi:probable BOI-related E3 ubiquitin-protein ligase 2 [Mangifera indica]|uniref:probable BOI-related E3 ubiquitin-protein ligase 2 n=1 Tax=Mangifera indica TaxID=29780 RepID=UPI001CFBCEB0|nr:probable BOI-related E3 ubiquitin-protein ligase 2 [Mangifera indica]